jgi:hypothetical protein
VRKARSRLDKASLDSGDSSLVSSGMLALAPPRVGVVVDPRVPGVMVSKRVQKKVKAVSGCKGECIPSKLV